MKLKKNHFANLQGSKEVIRGNTKYTVRNHRDRFFFPDEWIAFYDSLKTKKGKPSRQQITFSLLIHTGARIMEAQNIKVSDIDFDRANIVLRITKRIVNRPGVKAGVRKIRVVTISSRFLKFLRKAINTYKLKADDYLPVLTTPGANQVLKGKLKAIGIPDWDMFSIHNVRKTSEMWLLSLDIDSFKIVKRFGHSREIALRHYLSSDIFTLEEKQQIRDIVGDVFRR